MLSGIAPSGGLLHGHLNGLEDAVLCIGVHSGLALLHAGDLAGIIHGGNLLVGGLKLHLPVGLDRRYRDGSSLRTAQLPGAKKGESLPAQGARTAQHGAQSAE